MRRVLSQRSDMSLWILSLALGSLCGGLIVAARRVPSLAWIALTPLALVTAWGSPWQAACAGLVVGALQGCMVMSSRTLRSLLPLAASTTGFAWAVVALVTQQAFMRSGVVALLAVLPLLAALSPLFLTCLGAPRWAAAPLACTQERSLAVLHAAGRGGALLVTGALSLAGSAVAVLFVSQSAMALLMIVLVALSLLAFAAIGLWRFRRACRRFDAAPRMRVAAVVADAPAPAGSELDGLLPMRSPAYRDVRGALKRYRDHVREAAALGARLVVLPEVAVYVDEASRDHWLGALRDWARELHLTIVAPFLDAAVPVNTLVVINESGVLGHYDKQHPARGLEPLPRARSKPAAFPLGSVFFATVICVDLDYADLISPVRQLGGLLVAPSNDWFDGFEQRHDDTSVWAAVASGVSTLRSTGHGLSSLRDGAGRLLAIRSSQQGPVVLVVDAPVLGLSPPTLHTS